MRSLHKRRSRSTRTYHKHHNDNQTTNHKQEFHACLDRWVR